MNIAWRKTMLTTILLLPLSALPRGSAEASHAHDAELSGVRKSTSPLVEKVRRATARYRDVNVAITDGFSPGTPCVTGPSSGAMGVHFVHPGRLNDGLLKAEEPESLIYEPQANGSYRLVGVEYLVYADDWATRFPKGPAPSVDGHLAHLIAAPNRYGLRSFHELHVWAWEHNPEGNFVDWNPRVSCDKQAAP